MRWRTTLSLTATMTAVLLWMVTACASNDRLHKDNDLHQNFDDAKLAPLAGCPVSGDMDQSKIMDSLNESSSTQKVVIVRGATADSTIIEDSYSMRSEAGADIIMYMINHENASLTRLNETTAKKYGVNRLPDGTKLNIVWSANGWWIQSMGYYLSYASDTHGGGLCSLDGKKAVIEDAAPTAGSSVSPSSGPESDDLYVATDNGTRKLEPAGEDSDYTDESEPVFSPDSEKLAFIRDEDLYVANADGSEQENLTNGSAEGHSAAWWPDSERISFFSDGSIYVINADGTSLTRLTNNVVAAGNFEFSPDGKQVAFLGLGADAPKGGESAYDIYVMNADGSGLTNLTDKVTRSEKDTLLRVTVEAGNLPFLQQPFLFSPDSKQIAFVRDSYVPTKSVPLPTSEYDVYAVNVDGTDLTRLTYDEIPKHIVTWVWN